MGKACFGDPNLIVVIAEEGERREGWGKEAV
jgi:hypothetical protein